MQEDISLQVFYGATVDEEPEEPEEHTTHHVSSQNLERIHECYKRVLHIL